MESSRSIVDDATSAPSLAPLPVAQATENGNSRAGVRYGLEWRGAPAVPPLILPSGNLPSDDPSFQASAQEARDCAINAISGLRDTLHWITSRHDGLDEAFAEAVDAAAELASALSSQSVKQARLATLKTGSPHDAYLGILRAELTPAEMASETAAVVHRTLADLDHVLLDANDLVAEIEALLAVLAKLRISHETGDLGTTSVIKHRWDGLDRWVIGHHAYALFNLFAAAAIRNATRAIPNDEVAAAFLTEAAVFVRGATSSMLHAGAVSSIYYGAVIRPTMQPPAFPVRLSGTMSPDHATYRSALDRLLEVEPEPYASLSRARGALASAREALLQTDLCDIERHISLASALVGDERSLLQNDRVQVNAVTMLRRMRDSRALRYRPFIRYGHWEVVRRKSVDPDGRERRSSGAATARVVE